MYLDVCLLRDEADEPILAIAPAWKVNTSDLVIVEAKNGDRARATVEAVLTTEKDRDDYRFAASCFGDDPEKNRVIQKYDIEDLNWPD